MSLAQAETIRTADQLAVGNARKLLTLLSQQPEIDVNLRQILKAMGSENMLIVADHGISSAMLHQSFSEDEAGLLPKQLTGTILSVPMTMVDLPEDSQDVFVNDMIFAAAAADSGDWEASYKLAAKITVKLNPKIHGLVDAVRRGQ